MKKITILTAAALTIILSSSLAACGGSQSQKAAEGNDVIETLAEETTEAEISVAVEGNSGEDRASDSASDTSTGLSFGTFKTADLNGNEVDESIFAKKDYTMVNYWGTFCPPCIKEMPELAEISNALPENIQMIGLICDLPYGQEMEETKNTAENILDTNGVTYTNLLIWEDAAEMISGFSSFVPTTFFVDSEGNIVGDPIIGADLEAYKERIASLSEQ